MFRESRAGQRRQSPAAAVLLSDARRAGQVLCQHPCRGPAQIRCGRPAVEFPTRTGEGRRHPARGVPAPDPALLGPLPRLQPGNRGAPRHHRGRHPLAVAGRRHQRRSRSSARPARKLASPVSSAPAIRPSCTPGALADALPLERMKVYSPSPAQPGRFLPEIRRGAGNPPSSAQRNRARSSRESDVVCCATNSSAPVFDGRDLEPGQTVVSIVNSDVVFQRHEVDRDTITRSDLIVGQRPRKRSRQPSERAPGPPSTPARPPGTRWVELGEVVNKDVPRAP